MSSESMGRAFWLMRRLACSYSVWMFLGAFALAAVLCKWIAAMGGPEFFHESLGMIAPLVTVPIQIIVAITPFPSDVLCVANGALYGFWVGAGLSWIGWWIAALLEYGLGRVARKDFDLEANLARVPGLLRRFPVHHPFFLIGSRQVPWLGGHVSTFVPGAMGVGFGRVAWCSAIGIIPGSILMAAIGVGFLYL